MLILSRLKYAAAPTREHDAEVHPFYAAAFESVYGCTHPWVASEPPSSSRTRETIRLALRDVLGDGCLPSISCVYDVRACEEVSSVCLVYALLEELGIPTVRPMSVRGPNAGVLLESLTIADAMLRDGQSALVAVSQVLVAADDMPREPEGFVEGCFGFMLTKSDGLGTPSPGWEVHWGIVSSIDSGEDPSREWGHEVVAGQEIAIGHDLLSPFFEAAGGVERVYVSNRGWLSIRSQRS